MRSSRMNIFKTFHVPTHAGNHLYIVFVLLKNYGLETTLVKGTSLFYHYFLAHRVEIRSTIWHAFRTGSHHLWYMYLSSSSYRCNMFDVRLGWVWVGLGYGYICRRNSGQTILSAETVKGEG